MSAVDSVSGRDVKSAVSVSMMKKEQEQEKEVVSTLLSSIERKESPQPRGVGKRVDVKA